MISPNLVPLEVAFCVVIVCGFLNVVDSQDQTQDTIHYPDPIVCWMMW